MANVLTLEEIAGAVGREIRAIRTDAELAQQDISDLMDWKGRDATSKLERGVFNITLGDYLRLTHFLRDNMPADHPARVLYDHIARDVRRQSRVKPVTIDR